MLLYRRIPGGVCARLQLLVLVLHWAVVLVSSDVDSGSAECISPEPLLLSSPSSNISAGFILTSSQLCGGGCVTGWRYCYYAGNEHSVSVTFALWRRSDDNVSLEVVEESMSVAEMKTLPAEQWFVCEEKSVSGGSEVMVGDQVGVVIDSETSTLRVVGEGEGEEVLVGEREEGRRGSVSESSLVRLASHTLLVSAVTGVCGGPNHQTSSTPPSELPTTTNTPAPTPDTQPSPAPTPDTQPSAEEGGLQQLWVIVVCAVLALVITLLLIMTCFLITVNCRQRRLLQKRTPLQTILLNGDGKFSGGNSEVDFEMHILQTSSSVNSNSTSLSPTPHVASPAPHTLSTGQISSEWPPKVEEQPLLTQHSSPSASKKRPPPVRPKPQHTSSRTVDHSSPSLRQTTPTPVDSEPPHHLALCRSYSEEAIPITRPQGESPTILQPRVPGSSPRHLGLQSRVSTGSLPDFTTPSGLPDFTPSLDEDDYTIPTQHLFPRTHKRPQPYLQPHPIYSYAYTHVGAREFRTIPRGIPAPPVVKQRSLSERTNPYDSIRTPLTKPQEQELGYDEIFLSGRLQGKTTGPLVSPPPSSSSSSQPVLTGTRGTLHSVLSSPAAMSAPPTNPIVSEQLRLMSTASEASEGYMNENEYPRPSSLSAAELAGTHRKLHYTPLQPTLREECPTYDAPGSSCPEGPLSPSSKKSDYDHLQLNNMARDSI